MASHYSVRHRLKGSAGGILSIIVVMMALGHNQLIQIEWWLSSGIPFKEEALVESEQLGKDAEELIGQSFLLGALL
jgi:hypothetical protein